MNRIQEYILELNLETFKQDYKTVDAVIRNFEIIGEATKNLPKEVQAKYPDTPWSAMYRLRNRITHEYFGIAYILNGAYAKKSNRCGDDDEVTI
jgi:uncharacterized protein with HEPN domain